VGREDAVKGRKEECICIQREAHEYDAEKVRWQRCDERTRLQLQESGHQRNRIIICKLFVNLVAGRILGSGHSDADISPFRDEERSVFDQIIVDIRIIAFVIMSHSSSTTICLLGAPKSENQRTTNVTRYALFCCSMCRILCQIPIYARSSGSLQPSTSWTMTRFSTYFSFVDRVTSWKMNMAF
jgi:hypothetical protein